MSESESCLFCKIAARAIPAQIVFEDAQSLAFLDITPLFPGHALLIPKHHCQTLPELPVDHVGSLFINAQLLTRAVEEAMHAQGSFVAMNNRVSQSVPHLHVHIVPRKKKDGLRGFFWPKNPYRDEAHLVETAEAIRKKVEELK